MAKWYKEDVEDSVIMLMSADNSYTYVSDKYTNEQLHGHSNLSPLDKITDEKMNKWDTLPDKITSLEEKYDSFDGVLLSLSATLNSIAGGVTV